MKWMIYGANGFTGRLIAEEAVRRGMTPVLAGRNRKKLESLADELGLELRIFGLESHAAVVDGLAGIGSVAHCAGPFERTAQAMVTGCLEAKCHYLDITGELGVFESVAARDAEAARAGIVLCSGAGFDVIPTDCMAAKLAEALPDAIELSLGLSSDMSVSPGTAKSALGILQHGSVVRRGGRLQGVTRWRALRSIDYGDGVRRTSAPVPWGDLVTAYHTTGIPNITVYLPLQVGWLELLMEPLVRNVLRSALLRDWLGAVIERRVTGPDEEELETSHVNLWGEVRNARGERRVARMVAPNGYALTVNGVLAMIEFLFDYSGGGSGGGSEGRSGGGGYFTPVQLMGPDFSQRLAGCGPIEIS